MVIYQTTWSTWSFKRKMALLLGCVRNSLAAFGIRNKLLLCKKIIKGPKSNLMTSDQSINLSGEEFTKKQLVSHLF